MERATPAVGRCFWAAPRPTFKDGPVVSPFLPDPARQANGFCFALWVLRAASVQVHSCTLGCVDGRGGCGPPTSTVHLLASRRPCPPASVARPVSQRPLQQTPLRPPILEYYATALHVSPLFVGADMFACVNVLLVDATQGIRRAELAYGCAGNAQRPQNSTFWDAVRYNANRPPSPPCFCRYSSPSSLAPSLRHRGGARADWAANRTLAFLRRSTACLLASSPHNATGRWRCWFGRHGALSRVKSQGKKVNQARGCAPYDSATFMPAQLPPGAHSHQLPRAVSPSLCWSLPYWASLLPPSGGGQALPLGSVAAHPHLLSQRHLSGHIFRQSSPPFSILWS